MLTPVKDNLLPPTSFAVALREKRHAAGLTTAQLGSRIGVHSNVISYWENKKRVPAFSRQTLVLAALDTPNATVAELVSALRADIERRVERFSVDLQTLATTVAGDELRSQALRAASELLHAPHFERRASQRRMQAR